MDNDYKNFVERMGSFDNEFDVGKTEDAELMHFGVKGMKWGVKRANYKSTGIKSMVARRNNEKIDKSFKDWKENDNKKAKAIELGKKATLAKREYEKDKTNKDLKSAYKAATKEYAKALKSNTTYRKGAVKNEVGKDAARKYLSDAKKVKKQLDADPSNKALKKQHDQLMSKHDIERAKARRAPEVAANRSRAKAAVKRTMTMTAKAAVASAAIAGGTYAANRYLSNHDFTLNGNPMRVNPDAIKNFNKAVKAGQEIMRFF